MIVDGLEACDDGADGDNDDECTDLCLLPVCGDGFVQASLGETCDQALGYGNTATLGDGPGAVKCWGDNASGAGDRQHHDDRRQPWRHAA